MEQPSKVDLLFKISCMEEAYINYIKAKEEVFILFDNLVKRISK
jgi:hypothetical protein